MWWDMDTYIQSVLYTKCFVYLDKHLYVEMCIHTISVCDDDCKCWTWMDEALLMSDENDIEMWGKNAKENEQLIR